MPKSTKAIKVTDAGKAWNKQKTKAKPYAKEVLEKKQSFLIVCEGQNTEPEYFKSFPVVTADVRSFGLGSSKTKLVEDVLKIDRDKDDEVWVVFDMDINKENRAALEQDYDNAIALAHSEGVNVAYSNDTFEIWFLLHFQYFDNQWTRREYYKKLSEYWNANYEKQGKNMKFCRGIYQLLQDDDRASQDEAIKRAHKLHFAQKALPFSEQNPVTTVYELVTILNKHI